MLIDQEGYPQSIVALLRQHAPSQVYEREAIQRHLSHVKGAAVDPVSRAPLPSRELTPVFILRSRAMEFRESTARRNVERACAPGCPDPVRALPRMHPRQNSALELCANS